MNNSTTTLEKEILKTKKESYGLQSRTYSLDALRGLSILMMVFSASIPFGVLPDWMYHAQVPPPEHIFNPNLPGITWVDLIFPFFLFTMGAAIPLSLSKKIQQNISSWQIVLSLLNRSLLLAGFAIYIYHINPSVINPNPDWKTWALSILGFALLFPVLVRFPKGWNNSKKYLIRLSGLCLIIIFLSVLYFQYGRKFSVYQSDIIILVLANVAFFGGIIWLVSRNNWLLRLSLMGILIALRLSSTIPAWVQNLTNGSPIPWLFDVHFLQYLFIIIPGTIIGDLILKNMNSTITITNSARSNLIGVSILMAIINVIVVVGLKARGGIEIFFTAVFLIAVSWWIIKKSTDKENLIYKIFCWGIYWLILGFLFEPFEGGIKKDHPTLSYYFITSGLAIFVLIALEIIISILKKKKIFNLLIETGQNPLIAYAGLNNLVYPILVLVYINTLLDSISALPWFGVLKGVFITYLVALSAQLFTKYKIYLRA